MSELSELFDRNPLNLTDQDITTIVQKMREYQSQFELSGKAPAAPKPKKLGKAMTILKDLGLA